MENKYQTALDNVKTAPGFMGGNVRYKTVLESSIPFLEDIAVLQKLVDKEKPMKVTEKWSDDCPKCGEFMIDTCEYALRNIPFIKYCPHCGQKLDWGDDEDAKQ